MPMRGHRACRHDRMHGLSPETDLTPLNGTMLTFVGFGQYQVQLRFSGDVDCYISIEGGYLATPPGRESTTFTEAIDRAAVLLPLLGHTVTVASVPADGTVRLGFDDDTTAEVLDSWPHYESYLVQFGDRLLVV
jgi:hypothetical protein